jgi:hypothetical protein
VIACVGAWVHACVRACERASVYRSQSSQCPGIVYVFFSRRKEPSRNIHTHIHTYTHTYIHKYMYVYTHNIYIHTCIHTYVYTYTYIRTAISNIDICAECGGVQRRQIRLCDQVQASAGWGRQRQELALASFFVGGGQDVDIGQIWANLPLP